jgi:hypothetical protein
MQHGRGPKFRRIKGKPIRLKPQIVMKEVHGQMVAVKVYPAQYAQEPNTPKPYTSRPR